VREITAEVSRFIEADPKEVYAVLTDYSGGHQAILPKQYFSGLSVIEGGRGSGTIISVRMKVMGVKSRYQFHVTEPEPGRILVETDDVAGVVTTFTVDPADGGKRSRVAIATRSRASKGAGGLIERLVNPVIMHRI
jgi:hypothetical protein